MIDFSKLADVDESSPGETLNPFAGKRNGAYLPGTISKEFLQTAYGNSANLDAAIAAAGVVSELNELFLTWVKTEGLIS